jgi:outer membrane protein OmpA-like peptidoglycan-associated protein
LAYLAAVALVSCDSMMSRTAARRSARLKGLCSACTCWASVPEWSIPVEKNGSPVWVDIQGYQDRYDITVVEEKLLHSSIAPTQSEMQTAIDTSGRVTLHINFDFDRATLRPDALPVVQQSPPY